MQHRHAPVPTLRRLPMYLRVLRRLEKSGGEHVSCTHISQELNLDPTQVRKDLAFTGIVGRPRIGYEVTALIKAIVDFLGWQKGTAAVLIGAGSMGTALLGYEGFRKHGLTIAAAFDADPQKVGAVIHDKEVLPMERLRDFIQEKQIPVGILTLASRYAQEVAGALVDAGIKGIWNFTPVELEVPEPVVVENVQLSSSLAVLSGRLAEVADLSKTDSSPQ